MPRPTLHECFQRLGLPPSAGPRSVKQAFRKLAKRHHPDLNRAAPNTMDFVRIVEAYTTIQREFRIHAVEGDARPCPVCGRVAELFDGLDGDVECADCLLGISRRRTLLPPVSTRIVRHVGVMGLELAAVGTLIHALWTGSSTSLLASIGLSAAAILILAAVAVAVRVVK